ncbi:MAG TPA: homoserine O-acetyltransferase [Candidatus Kapabacteria bacterium]|jgi:homoserine O-acetyltransferase|nr:homoserine O-acetyltransferase [Candidatus Kapabacteria bacterium]
MLKSQYSIVLNEKPFALVSGASLPEVEIAYDSYGSLNEDRSNVVLVLHALTGWSAAQEWWPGIIGDGKLLDPSEYFILCPNLLGSCYGSTGPESINPLSGASYFATFPEITVRDIAKATLHLLDALEIDTVRLAIGGSMGGMVILEMAALAPSRFQAIIPIAVTGSHSAWRIAFSSTVRKVIVAADPTLRDKTKLAQGLYLARQFAMTSYRCPEEFEERFGRTRVRTKFEVENYLEHQGEKIVGRFSPYSYLTLTRAMELYDLAEGRMSLRQVARSIEARALFIGISSDILYSTREIESFASSFPNAEYATLDAAHGHDSFLVDTEALSEIIAPFLLGITIDSKEEAFA